MSKAVRPHEQEVVVERVQTGVRIEKRILKVLKALAEYHDLTLGDFSKESSSTRSRGSAPSRKKTSRASPT